MTDLGLAAPAPGARPAIRPINRLMEPPGVTVAHLAGFRLADGRRLDEALATVDLASLPAVSDANRQLERLGVKLTTYGGRWWLAVANWHPELHRRFAPLGLGDLHMGMRREWTRSLQRYPGAQSTNGLRFQRRSCRSTIVPIEAFAPASTPENH